MSKRMTKAQLDRILARYDARMEVREDGEPIRTIFNGRRNRPVGLYPSIKSGRMIARESHLERLAIRWLETDYSVESYLDQPHTLYFSFNGKKTHYTPDYQITRSNASISYLEVKYFTDLRTMPQLERERLKLARTLYRSVSRNLEFFTDRRLRIHPMWATNAELIEQSRRLTFGTDALAALIEHLEARREYTSTLGACAAAIGDPDFGEARVLALALRRIVRLALDEPLDSDAQVTLEYGYRARIRSMGAL